MKTMLARQIAGHAGPPTSVPVAIVGGGPVGLYTAALLRRMGIQSLVLERASQTPAYEHPRAHVLHTRTMELMREMGLEKAIHEAAPPPEQWRHFRYCESITGRDLGVVDHFTLAAARNLSDASPSKLCHLSQPKLERILHGELCRTSDATGDMEILYGHQVTAVTQQDSKVVLDVNAATGSTFQLSCDHVIAADGATGGLREMCGVELTGRFNLQHFMSVHFTCPALADKVLPKPGMLYFVFNREVIAVLVAHNIEQGIWNLQLPYYPPHQVIGSTLTLPISMTYPSRQLLTLPLPRP